MTLDEADILLAQWADWSANELSKLGHSKSKWQMDYCPGFVEEASANELPPAEDIVMLDVDTALALLRAANPYHFQVIRGRYVMRQNFTRIQLDSAMRAFIFEYQSPLDEGGETSLTLVCGRSCL